MKSLHISANVAMSSTSVMRSMHRTMIFKSGCGPGTVTIRTSRSTEAFTTGLSSMRGNFDGRTRHDPIMRHCQDQ